MMDTSGIPDSLPLTSLSMDTALLQWGLFDSALAKVGFYFDTFIFPNGTAGPPPPAAHARFVSSLDSTTVIAEIATRCKSERWIDPWARGDAASRTTACCVY